MKTKYGHLTYCTNIHAGESWRDHFKALRDHIPAIKKQISPRAPFGIGLRLSHLAAQELGQGRNMVEFKAWLEEQQCYVFTMNGFPYGGFHHTKVKDHVHTPDWTTQDRVLYTLNMFSLLSRLLPAGMDGGISTSPLSYRHWHEQSQEERRKVFEMSTWNLLQVVEELIRIHRIRRQVLHIDIEPEPDGLIESGPEFISWYKEYLLPAGVNYLSRQLKLGKADAIAAIKKHVRLCYDICHFAVGYEDHASVIKQLNDEGIQIGKIQISAALMAGMSPVPGERDAVVKAFSQFNESTYLHQVVALQQGRELKRYPDLPEALEDAHEPATREWRAHFHVPLFVENYGVLRSTQEDISKVLSLHKKKMFTSHLEVETYTWEVLPKKMKVKLTDSIVREMKWVIDFMR